MKKLWFSLMLVFILLSVSACNAEQECPVEVQTGIEHKYYSSTNMSYDYYTVRITSISDNVIINDVIANRGNTKHELISLVNYPITMKFGGYITIYYKIPLKEIEVQTNTGNWVFKP